MREDAKMSWFKTVGYDLSPGIAMRYPLSISKFTYASGSVRGHWALSAEISLSGCVLNFLSSFFR